MSKNQNSVYKLMESEDSVNDGQGLSRRQRGRGKAKRTDLRNITREDELAEGEVWAICLGNSTNLVTLRSAIISKRIHGYTEESSYSDVLCLRCFDKQAHCFVFRFGCVVCWDLTVGEKCAVKALVCAHTEANLTAPEIEQDDMKYTHCSKVGPKHMVRKDVMHLCTTETAERLAFSYGFSQSVKLSVFETLVDRTIENTKEIPESLLRSGKVNLSRQHISKKIGQLFIQRCYVNLHTDILDTPEIFWDCDEFVDQYDSCRHYLEIPKRVDILNQRLDIVKDLYDMLNDELAVQVCVCVYVSVYVICMDTNLSGL
eukprot:GHVR01017218.1.p1 GENE.GHVR01017218.1~~GHVR01017218.1.p1  ORF type:complete len:315 (+),score=59.12 GHVR01017218.1:33-977(+)